MFSLPHKPLRPTLRELGAYVRLGQGQKSATPRRGKMAGTGTHGRWLSPQRGQGMEMDAVRAYVPGDEVRHIDWSITARTGVPHVQLYREERQHQVVFLVDDGPWMQFGTRGTFKNVMAARVAAYLGGWNLAARERVGGVVFQQGAHGTGAKWFAPQSLRRPLFEMMGALADMPQALPPVVETHDLPGLLAWVVSAPMLRSTPTMIYLISDFGGVEEPSQERWAEAMAMVRSRHRLAMVAVEDPADARLPEGDGWRLAGLGGERLEMDGGGARSNVIYAAWWERRKQLIEGLAGRMGCPMVRIGTDMRRERWQTLVTQL